jgi:hypothetical protein
MSWGGKRTGAGRRPNRYNAEREERARKSGALPSEIMLELGRFCRALVSNFQPAKDANGKLIWAQGDKETFVILAKLAADLLGKAAPYCEQRLAQIHEIRRVDLSLLSDAELNAFEDIVTKATDHPRDSSGAPATLN